VTTAIRITLAIALAPLATWWQLAGHPPSMPASALAFAAVALVVTLIAVIARARLTDATIPAGPLLRRAVALRRKSWGAVFQRQRDPDAAGRARPRAPSAAPAAA
jgi:hypothetical protein